MDGTPKWRIETATVIDRWIAAHGIGCRGVASVFSNQESVEGRIAAYTELLVGCYKPVEPQARVAADRDITACNKQGIGQAGLYLRIARNGQAAGCNKGGYPRRGCGAWIA